MRSRTLLTLAVLLAAGACGAPVDVTPRETLIPDAAMPLDAGGTVDAGNTDSSEWDAGLLEDAGVDVDSGVTDAGTPATDGGAPVSWRQRVIYLVMPDRFFNGDPSNDQAGVPNCFDRADPRRFHGGDFAGLRAKLPYLRELGVSAIWMTPANLQIGRTGGGSCGYHGYWADLALPDDGAVEPKLGTSAELRGLVTDAHHANMSFILDLVVNHTGSSARLKTQRPTWFHDPATCAQLGDRTVTCPLGNLPDLAQEQPDVAQYLDTLSSNWVRDYGIDGIRMDTAKHVPRSYFRDRWFPAVRAVRPDLFTVAEVYLEGSASDLKPFLDTGFSSTFNFPLRRALVNSLARGGSVDEIADVVRDDVSTLGLARTLELTSFVDNHDVPRFVSIVSGVPEEETQRRYTLALTALFTLPGIPQLYAGNELGQYGGGDPDNRRDLPAWAFDATTRAARHQGEAVPRPGDVFTRIQTLATLRTMTPALFDGEYTELWRQNGAGNPNVFAFGRRAGDSQVIVVINNSAQPANVDLQAPAWAVTTARYEEVLRDGASALTLPGVAFA